jgi:LPXTG-motif cell wall-anchored protein
VARRYLQVALIPVLAVVISPPAVLAHGAGGDCARCPSRVAAHLAQDDPRDPFGRDDTPDAGTSADAGTGSGEGDTTSPSGATSAGTLPLTGSTATLLMAVAGLLLFAGGLALWMTRYRPRHAGYRPRHAR